jgi:hypothetical protein
VIEQNAEARPLIRILLDHALVQLALVGNTR